MSSLDSKFLSVDACGSRFLLTFPETVKYGASRGDNRQRAQYQGDNQLQIRVDRGMLWYVLIDLERWHRAAGVRLQSCYSVLGDRETRVIVRPHADVVGRSGLQLAERVRLLYLNNGYMNRY